jgi:predicted acetyltransferase
MAVDLLAMREDVPRNAEVVITEIQDLEHLRILRDLEMQGFGVTEEMAQRYYDVYAGAGFGNSLPLHHFIGWLHGTPVAIASLLFHAGVAGIYGVATIPEARRQGVGATMTLHVLRVARSTGYRIAILSPTAMSEAIYRRIGFNEYCQIHHYGSPSRR